MAVPWVPAVPINGRSPVNQWRGRSERQRIQRGRKYIISGLRGQRSSKVPAPVTGLPVTVNMAGSETNAGDRSKLGAREGGQFIHKDDIGDGLEAIEPPVMTMS